MADSETILFDILEQIQATVQGLGLDQMPPANVLIQKVPTNRTKDLPADRYPAVIIAPWGPEGINPSDGTNSRDDINYRVGLWILASDAIDSEQPGQQQAKDFKLYVRWRQAVRKAFHNQRLTSTYGHKVEVNPLDVVDRAMWLTKGLWISGMVLNVTNRETRV